jgi:hypothetical protein
MIGHRAELLVGVAEVADDEPAQVVQVLHDDRSLEAVLRVDLRQFRRRA